MRNERPGTPQGEIFKIVAEMWKEAKRLATDSEKKREEDVLEKALGRLELE